MCNGGLDIAPIVLFDGLVPLRQVSWPLSVLAFSESLASAAYRTEIHDDFVPVSLHKHVLEGFEVGFKGLFAIKSRYHFVHSVVGIPFSEFSFWQLGSG